MSHEIRWREPSESHETILGADQDGVAIHLYAQCCVTKGHYAGKEFSATGVQSGLTACFLLARFFAPNGELGKDYDLVRADYCEVTL
jgi:hypothetical protein